MSQIVDLRNAADARDVVHRAVQLLAEGRLVGLPTETGYVAAGLPIIGDVVLRLGSLAQRLGRELPILAIKHPFEALDYIPQMGALSRKLTRRFWPGPVTMLFQERVSPGLAELFPDSVHVFNTGLARFTSDEAIWEYARAKGFTIVTADSDSIDPARSRGAPPKVVRLENCNYRTSQVEDLMRRHAILMAELEQPSRATLIIRYAT